MGILLFLAILSVNPEYSPSKPMGTINKLENIGFQVLQYDRNNSDEVIVYVMCKEAHYIYKVNGNGEITEDLAP